MQILWRLIVRPLRRSNIATSPASVRRLVCTSQPVLCSMASGTPRSWSSALARRVSPRFAAANPPTCRVSRFDCGSRNMASSRGVKEDQRRARVNIISCDEDAFRTAMEVMDSKPDTTGGNVDKESWAAEIPGDSMDYVRSPMDILPDSSHCDGSIYSGMPGNVYVADCELSSDDRESWAAEIPGDSMDYVPPPMYILPHSSHRDGSIYSGTPSWKRDFLIADRTETRLEAMMFSHPTDCGINGVCRRHHTRHMLQIFSLKLTNIPMERGPIELYGYIAARDNVDRLLNYVINFSREDPIIVEQGSHIDMAGPKRGIKVVDTTLIEFDMKIKAGRHEKQDLQLIDGVSFVDDIDPSNCSPFTYRIHGDCGAIDITAARLNFAVEATMEVAISQVQGGFSMRMGCFTSGIHKEIRLFDGAITESRGLKRAVIAVAMGDQMDLKFKVAADSCIPAEHCCSFKAARHGRATQEIKTEFALIAVKVTWSTLV